jgi:hypothetical protein
MFFKTYGILEQLTDYTKRSDGTWNADVPALLLQATGSSPIECRHRLVSQLDERLAAWLVKGAQGMPTAPTRSSRKKASPI